MAARDDALFRMLDLGLPDELPDADWRRLGFADPARIKEGLARLRARVDVAKIVELRFADLLRALAQTPDPDRAFAGLERWLEAGGAALGGSPMDWCEERFLQTLLTLFAGTPALAEYFIRFPNRTRAALKPVAERSVAGGLGWLRALQQSANAAQGHAAKLAALRRGRAEAMLQIAALDLLNISPLEDTVRAISDLADACVEVALACAIERHRARLGTAAPLAAAGGRTEGAPPPFVVLGMGKLGGRELNYSSDIDLIFAYAGEGETAGVERPVAHEEYFRRVGEDLIAALADVTEDGLCYRVDMRLRPYGAAGALAMPVAAVLAYLQAEGRTWERQAWLKARPCAGDLALGDALLLEAAPFVYRRYLSLDAIGDLQALKRQMELSVARRGETDDEVKLGRGGIRDIEFTVQFLQLLHGAQHPNVRGGHTLHALRNLRKAGLLTDAESKPLEQAYVFLRNVEHRLQLHGNLQTHKLPADRAVRRRIARSLGFEDGEGQKAEAAFEAHRQKTVETVRAIFENLFANLFRDRRGPEGELSDLLLAPRPEPEQIAALLGKLGFPPSAEAAGELLRLGKERLMLMNPSRTRKFFASVAPQIMRALASTGEPLAALNRFSRIAGSLGGKAVFFQALHENPWLLKMTAELAAWSEYLTEILVANPGLFDELVDSLRTNRSKTMDEMTAELAEVARAGEIGDTLRAYRAGELLRIGVRDLFHAVPLEQTQGELTDLAHALLRAQVAHAYAAFKKSRGEVRGADGTPVGFGILAVGKFGGREMNYGSDLDVLFFYDRDGESEKGLPAGPYFSEFAQALTRAMAERTALGSLYHLDARLRPNGSKGPLASSLEAFERYWKDGSLADWERLALTRARAVAGDKGVGERAEHLIRTAVYSPLRSGELGEEVKKMRRRIEEHGDREDLKTGRGGIVDIEFLVQYLQLLYGPAFPKLRQTNTRAALDGLIQHGKLSTADGAALRDGYAFLTRLANRVRIVHGLSANKLPQEPEDLHKLALRAQYANEGGTRAGERLRADYTKHTEAVRAIFERVVV